MDEVSHLLGHDEPDAFGSARLESHSPFVIICDHASKRIPASLNQLGLPQSEIDRHIGWDIGAKDTAVKLSALLDAPLIYQNYSRLVIDCNRRPSHSGAFPEISESTLIPGNIDLPNAQKQLRIQEIFTPYHNAIAKLLDERQRQNLPTCLIAMHSFTPVFKGVSRPWHVGVLFDRFADYANLVLANLRQESALCVGANEPYAVGDSSDYAVPVHAYERQLPYVELEIRQDLLEQADGPQQWAERLAQVLPKAWNELNIA